MLANTTKLLFNLISFVFTHEVHSTSTHRVHNAGC